MGNAEVAAELDLSKRTLQYDKEIVRKLPDPIRQMVKGMQIGNVQRELRDLAKLNILEQAGVVSLIKGGEARSVKEAKRSMDRQGTRVLTESTPSPEIGLAPYRTIVVDPPWSGADSGDVNPFGKAAPAYQTMTRCARPTGRARIGTRTGAARSRTPASCARSRGQARIGTSLPYRSTRTRSFHLVGRLGEDWNIVERLACFDDPSLRPIERAQNGAVLIV